jgi:hypothetical protein
MTASSQWPERLPFNAVLQPVVKDKRLQTLPQFGIKFVRASKIVFERFVVFELAQFFLQFPFLVSQWFFHRQQKPRRQDVSMRGHNAASTPQRRGNVVWCSLLFVRVSNRIASTGDGQIVNHQCQTFPLNRETI